MNPSVAVAFMTKMKMIFETDATGKPQSDSFLAFQNGSFAVGKETFYFMEPDKHGLGANETAQWLMNFDKTFNFVATVDDLITSAPDELDQVYYQTLKNCVPATSSRTPDQEARYNAALAYLQQTVPGSDGQPVTILDNYQRYDDVYKAAVSTYKNSRIAADSATGPGAAAVQQTWKETAPELQRACDLALLDCETKGRKTQVEANLATFVSLSGSSPLKTVADMKSDYELFGKTTALDPAGNEINYLPTQFSPVNFFDSGVSWLTLSLDKSEINSLLQRASPKLKNLFQLDGNSDIEHMTVEYTVVEILRNWFHVQDFILQRFWKLPAGTAPLADGQGQGQLPAYPAKLVFIRNVTIVAPKAPQPAPGPFRFSTLLFARAQPSAVPQLQSKAALFQARAQRTQQQVTSFRTLQAQLATTAAPRVAVRSLLLNAVVRPAVVGAVNGHLAAPLTMASVLSTVKRDALVRAPVLTPPARTLQGSLLQTIPPIRIPVSQPTTAPGLETTVHADMELLAFVCRKLPLCPNPDPSLPWS